MQLCEVSASGGKRSKGDFGPLAPSRFHLSCRGLYNTALSLLGHIFVASSALIRSHPACFVLMPTAEWLYQTDLTISVLMSFFRRMCFSLLFTHSKCVSIPMIRSSVSIYAPHLFYRHIILHF